MIRAVLGFAILGVLWAIFHFDLTQYLTINYIKSQQALFDQYYQQNQLLAVLGFLVIYVATTALSIPGAAVLTLLGGALFGVVLGTVVVSFASTIGATLAFLTARFFLRDFVQNKFKDRIKSINEGVRKNGAFYLFSLRLIPAFPFVVVNLVMGLTPIRTYQYFFVSQLGMLPGTIVYVNAGTQLASIDSLSGILSPEVILSFVLLGLFPLLVKTMVGIWKRAKVYGPFKRPKKFDYNMVVIGAGSGGLVSAYIAAAVKAKVALIEKHKMGGDCLNTGCVPSKALIKSAKMFSYASRAKEFGLESMNIQFNFAQVMERVQRVIGKVEPHDSVERYTGLGVECIQGSALIKDPFRVEVGGKTLTTQNIVVATGAGPLIPPISGLDKVGAYNTDNLWNMRELPKRFLVLGGGPIGCELAQCFQRFGSQVTVVEMAPRLLVREDDDASQYVSRRFAKEGIKVLVGHKAKEFRLNGGRKELICQGSEGDVVVEFDECLLALGRKANVKGFGLEELGIELTPRGTIATDETLRTKYPNIFACGDVVGPYQFTHTASHQAWYAAVNSLFSPFVNYKVNYDVIPWCTYTDPEVARVGLNELEAKEKGIPHQVTVYGIDDLDRAIADEEDDGFVKVLTVPGKDKILGVTIVGDHAGDIIAEYVSAMKNGFGLNKILGTIHIYPTLAEANKMAAGAWKKANAPQGLLEFAKKFHSWRR